MKKALILTGKEKTTERVVESYQLLIDCSYISTFYEGSGERILFFEELSDTFVRRMLEENSPLEVGVYNGLRINTQTGCHERISKLEEELVGYLSEMISTKLKQSKVGIIPIPSRN